MKAGEVIKWIIILVAVYVGWRLLQNGLNGVLAGQLNSGVGGNAVPYTPGGMPGYEPYLVQQWTPYSGYGYGGQFSYQSPNVSYRPDRWDPASSGRYNNTNWWQGLGNVSWTPGNGVYVSF